MPNGEIDGKQHYSVWIGAKTEHALQFVEHSINEGWEYVSILCVHQFSQRIAVEMNRHLPVRHGLTGFSIQQLKHRMQR